jgi:hypothetical protein
MQVRCSQLASCISLKRRLLNVSSGNTLFHIKTTLMGTLKVQHPYSYKGNLLKDYSFDSNRVVSLRESYGFFVSTQYSLKMNILSEEHLFHK